VTVMTEQEWAGLQATLVTGGLREYVDGLLRKRAPSPLPISEVNRAMLYEAYDDGNGNTVEILVGENGYYEGWWGGSYMMEGTEIDGVAYNICPTSGGGGVTVYVGDAILENMVGEWFQTVPEAKAYIRGLTDR
jgi:hypothetical protein